MPGLYFDSKVMTRREIFNKYKLNKTIYACTLQNADSLWDIIAVSFEKLCETDLNPDAVIERLLYWLW